MKVLQIMAGAKVGGAEGFFERLVPALARAGLKQSAIIRHHPARRASLTDAGVPVTECRFGGPLDLMTRRKVDAIIRTETPDIVLTWMSRAAQFLPQKPAGARYIAVGRLGGYYDLKYFKRCDHLVGNTEDLRQYLISQGWPEDRSWYLPNFVDATAAPPIDRALFDTPSDVPLLLCLGRLHKNKGFDTALHALSQLATAHPTAHLWIAGSGPEEAALKALAESLGIGARVRFLGWRNDVPSLLAASDIFVCSSRHEPLGNMVLEAWAHRVPMVACAAQGPQQLITDRETGLLVPIDDAAMLAEKIGELISNSDAAQGYAAAGALHFEQHFSEAAVVKQYLDFFHSLTGSTQALGRAGAGSGGNE